MPWVRFTQDFDWKPHEKVMIAYKAGSVYLVKQIVADLAISDCKAVMTERPQKERVCQQEI